MTTTSAEVGELYTALIAAQAEFAAVPKTAENPFFKSKYADLPAIMAVTGPVLAKHGLGVTMPPGRGSIFARLIHISGQWQESEMDLLAIKTDPQAQGSAITYARRYAYCSVLGIVTEVDDDGNAASARGKPRASGPEEVTAAQLRMLGITFGEKGIVDRTDRLAFASAEVGRELTTSKELTKAEATRVIKVLGEMPNKEA